MHLYYEHLFRKIQRNSPRDNLRTRIKKRALQQRPFVLSIGEHPQTLNAITKGKRKLNTALALKIEEKLNLEEGILVLLQTYFDMVEEKRKSNQSPNLTLLRKSLFWDTDMTSINWEKQFKAVIQRIFERGNEAEKKELELFYGASKVKIALSETSRAFSPPVK